MKNLRTFEILDFLKEKKYVSFPQLMEKFNVSQATVHRDVADLAEKGLLRKIQGGAAWIEPDTDSGRMTVLSSSFQERINLNRAKKRKLAQAAFRKIQDGDIVFLDSSTTVFFLAEELLESAFSTLTIVTNSAMIIQNFHKFPKQYVLVGLGGSFDRQMNAFLGPTTLRQAESLAFTRSFFSAFGVTKDTVTSNHETHAELLRAVRGVSRNTFILADSTKKGRSGLFRIGTPDQFTGIMTDGDKS